MPQYDHRFGRRITIGFAFTLLIAGVIAVVAVYALRSVTAIKDAVLTEGADDLIRVEKLRFHGEEVVASSRGFLLTAEPGPLRRMLASRVHFLSELHELRKVVSTPEGQELVNAIERADREHQVALDEIIGTRATSKSLVDLGRLLEEKVQPLRMGWSAPSMATSRKRSEVFASAAWRRRSSCAAARCSSSRSPPAGSCWRPDWLLS